MYSFSKMRATYGRCLRNPWRQASLRALLGILVFGMTLGSAAFAQVGSTPPSSESIGRPIANQFSSSVQGSDPSGQSAGADSQNGVSEGVQLTQIGLPGVNGVPTTRDLKDEFNAELATSQAYRNMAEALARRGSVMFRDTPLQDVLYTLGDQWRVNIVAGSAIQGTANGVFQDAPLSEILEAILTVNNLGYRQSGSSLIVLEQSSIGPANPSFQSDSFLVPETISSEGLDEIATALRAYVTPGAGQIQPVPTASKILVYDTPERIEAMRTIFQSLTGQAETIATPSPTQGGGGLSLLGSVGETEIIQIRPQYVPVASVAQAIELTVSSGVTFAAIENEQVLLVTGTAEALRRARQAAAAVDVPRPQVRITSYIYDVSLNELERLGFDWSSQTMSQSLDANGIPRNNIRMDAGLLTRNPPTLPVQPLDAAATAAGAGAGAATSVASGPTGGQWFFRTLSSNWELSTVLQALDETKGAKLLADPHVTVVDRETAEISIVTKIPVQQLTQTQQGGAIGTTAFEEAGIKLNVTPRIANDGTVEMVVEPEFSTLSGFNNGNPVIDARRARTTVRVLDRHTLVLGGLRQKTAVETVTGIPGLMNIKLIGKLFRAHNTEMRESELICFIQPEIVNFHATGLGREEFNLHQSQIELSRIPLICPGPHVPDCGDPYCPNHHPRPRPNRGMPDNGLILDGSVSSASWQAPMADTTPTYSESIMIPHETQTDAPISENNEFISDRLRQPPESSQSVTTATKSAEGTRALSEVSTPLHFPTPTVMPARPISGAGYE